jgi:hypothetical protein
MAMIRCTECGKDFSDQAKACVHCGARNPSFASPGRWLGRIVMGGAILFVILLSYGCLLGAMDPESEARAKDRDVISYCEDQYQEMKDDPRLSKGARGIAYGACEKLKADYRQKWNREP